MNKTQEKVLNLIADSYQKTGEVPSNQQIAKRLKKSRQAIDQAVTILIAMGKLQRQPRIVPVDN